MLLIKFLSDRKLLVAFVATIASCIVGTIIKRRIFARLRRQRYALADRSSDIAQVAVITGASGGLGREIALIFAQRRCHLVITARNKDALGKVAEECRAAGAKSVLVSPADVTDPEEVNRLVADVDTLVGHRAGGKGHRLGVLVLNAGRGSICPFDETPDSERIARELMEVNYFSNVRLCRALLPTIKTCASNILVISSLSGVFATPGRTTYCASKFALQGFFSALRMELDESAGASEGARVTIVSPGFVQTPFHGRVMVTSAAGGEAPPRTGSFMSAAECARQAVAAMEEERQELVMTWKGWLGYVLRPLLPGAVDGFARMVAKGSLKQQK